MAKGCALRADRNSLKRQTMKAKAQTKAVSANSDTNQAPNRGEEAAHSQTNTGTDNTWPTAKVNTCEMGRWVKSDATGGTLHPFRLGRSGLTSNPLECVLERATGVPGSSVNVTLAPGAPSVEVASATQRPVPPASSAT